MERKIYDEKQLWNVHTEETKKWIGKYAVVTLKDGGIVSGRIVEVHYATNENKSDRIREHLWVDIVIDRKISIRNVRLLEILKD